jgi:hypothetical protein
MTVHEIYWIIRTVAKYATVVIFMTYAMHFLCFCLRRYMDAPRTDVFDALQRNQQN